ncbi:glycosyltransferase family 4 protein [Amphritea balenae]|uniref:Glycosyltransferase family 1 protein n=1 Tax=Amphritea balenae TaxID=452629 RepID=A0A3P1STG1_9GAMM|nr:glycosyltransferase family 4 protein [Amphritea balenae]RRD00195.1 glycosyltransferase family 1 protein [Amphritea balenae]GGK77483.1 hypothetical protein GCM10007941_29500 [Amphritea balenae]
MKIIFLHNYYQIGGGEDFVLENERDILVKNGKVVELVYVDNDSIVGFFSKIRVALGTIFSIKQYYRIKRKLLRSKPSVVHVHNYFPIFSPSIFYSCSKVKCPVVHTLHNYRAVCPSSLLMHDGQINETSILNSSWWAVKSKVYRNSFLGSFILFVMVEFHKFFQTWNNHVDLYIVLTEFSKKKYIEAGWPENKICIKPNFIEDPFFGVTSVPKKGGYALYVGRLSEEKGLSLLLSAWEQVDASLKIIGDGPLKEQLESNVTKGVEYLGRKDKEDVFELVRNADFILMPSTWYEGFPMVLVEAFACGTPAVVSRLGSMEEIVEDGLTGLHFEPGNLDDLANKAQWMIEHPEETRRMGESSRQEYLDKYTPEKNYEMLMDIYQQAIAEAKVK